MALIFDDSYKARCVRLYAAFSPSLRSERAWGGGGTSRPRRCASCINSPDGCASTLTAHYHKECWSNFLGTGSSKMMATAVLEIYHV